MEGVSESLYIEWKRVPGTFPHSPNLSARLEKKTDILGPTNAKAEL